MFAWFRGVRGSAAPASTLASAVRPVIEGLEVRRMLSAAVPEVVAPIAAEPSVEAGREALVRWKDEDVKAKAGEWIVKVDRGDAEAPKFDPATGELLPDPTARGNTSTTPTQKDQPFFAGVKGLGFKFAGYLGSEEFMLVTVPAALGHEQVQARLQNLPGFEYVEPNLTGFGPAVVEPNDPLFTGGNLWGLKNTGQTGGVADADIDAPEAWAITTGWEGLVVGVLDSGVDYTHTDLVGNIWANTGEVAGDGIDNDNNGFIDDYYGFDAVNNIGSGYDYSGHDDSGHGTHVAGTIAGRGNNGKVVTGVAWRAKVMPIRILADNVTFEGIIRGINYAEVMRRRGVNNPVTNNSWGFNPGLPGQELQSLTDAVAKHERANMLFVAAAGNSDTDLDLNNVYPASLKLANVVTVGATIDDDTKAWYSSHGTSVVDIAAPGGDVDRVTYAPIDGIVSSTYDGSYGPKSGTSMAAPHVAGVAALAWSVAPDAHYTTIRDAILNGADVPLNSSGGQKLGAFVTAGRRLNAAGALAQLNPASLTVNGDRGGVAEADDILVRLDPAKSAYLEVLFKNTSGTYVRTHRALLSGLTHIDVNALGGDDIVTVNSAVTLPVTLTGGSGHDSMTGGSGNDELYGGLGNDTLAGAGGKDLVAGVQGNDYLTGSAGNDTLYGHDGNDSLYGESGHDLVYGQNGDDFVGGGDHDDTLYGGAGNDYLEGALGNDVEYGDAGIDSIYGGAGNDTLTGGSEKDYLYGNEGIDYLYARDLLADGAIYGGPDDDYAQIDDPEDTGVVNSIRLLA